MLEYLPDRMPPVDREIQRLIGGLIRNGKQIDALRQALSSYHTDDPLNGVSREQQEAELGIEELMQVHRETEARLQVVIAGVERRFCY